MSGAETMRPEPPDDCGCPDRVWPRCGHEGAPTVPGPRPCQQRALVDALHRADGAARDVRQASMALAEGAKREAWAVYLRERAARG